MPSAIFRQWDFKLPIASLTANRNGDAVAFALGDGSLRLFPATVDAEKPKEMSLHSGVSLALQPDADGHAFLSGGDDGKVFIVDPNLDVPTAIAEHKGRWIDHVAGSPEGCFRAYSTGKKLILLNDEGSEVLSADLPSSAGGVAFSPNGKRLAASHYNGVSLFWTNAENSKPTSLIWKGSHLHTAWHPDGKILMTSLQENALHGWRLSDGNEMRMQGYAAKIHSIDFTIRGRYLATSGSPQVICWPFFGGGPWGKAPLTLGSAETRLVTQVAAHPKDELVAAGYDDGMIILAPLDGRMEFMINPPNPGKTGRVVGLAWSKDGDCLFAALEDGRVFLFTIESVRKSVRHV